VAIGRGRESALLAFLLLHPNEPLASDRIVEELLQEQWFVYAARQIGGMHAVPLLWNGGQRDLAGGLRKLRVDRAFLVSELMASPQQAAATARTLGSVLREIP
jgi:hypothetical protein